MERVYLTNEIYDNIPLIAINEINRKVLVLI